MTPPNERMTDEAPQLARLQRIQNRATLALRYHHNPSADTILTDDIPYLIEEVRLARAQLLKVTEERKAWEKKFWEARYRVQELPTVNGTYGSVELYAALKAIDSVTSEAPEQGEPAIPRPNEISVKFTPKPLADPVDTRCVCGGVGCNSCEPRGNYNY